MMTADETAKPPVTDSRFPGFNPEVEASHAETAALINTAPTPTAAAQDTSAPPAVTPYRCGACGGLFAELADVCPACGVSGQME